MGESRLHGRSRRDAHSPQCLPRVHLTTHPSAHCGASAPRPCCLVQLVWDARMPKPSDTRPQQKKMSVTILSSPHLFTIPSITDLRESRIRPKCRHLTVHRAYIHLPDCSCLQHTAGQCLPCAYACLYGCCLPCAYACLYGCWRLRWYLPCDGACGHASRPVGISVTCS